MSVQQSNSPASASPLGVDAKPAETPVVAQDKPAETKQEVPAKPVKQISVEEFDALQQKASNYDIISNDPEIAPKIVEHYRAKRGEISSSAVKQQEQQNTSSLENHPEFKRLKEDNLRLARNQAAIDIRLFQQANPDMLDYKDDMAKLMNTYPNMNLDDAYRFSKLAKQQSAQKPVGATPVSPTTETNNSAGELDTSTDENARIQKLINDPKATPRLDDALDLAWKHAQRLASRT